jgi:hypothetical protein
LLYPLYWPSHSSLNMGSAGNWPFTKNENVFK